MNFQICNLLNCYERHIHKKLKNIEYPAFTGKKQNFWGWWVIFYFINFEGIWYWWQTKYNVFWMETRFFWLLFIGVLLKYCIVDRLFPQYTSLTFSQNSDETVQKTVLSSYIAFSGWYFFDTSRPRGRYLIFWCFLCICAEVQYFID